MMSCWSLIVMLIIMEYCPEVNIKFDGDNGGDDDDSDYHFLSLSNQQGTLESLCLGTENGLEETM